MWSRAVIRPVWAVMVLLIYTGTAQAVGVSAEICRWPEGASAAFAVLIDGDEAMLTKAVEVFEQAGLPAPEALAASGWEETAEIAALVAHIADSQTLRQVVNETISAGEWRALVLEPDADEQLVRNTVALLRSRAECRQAWIGSVGEIMRYQLARDAAAVSVEPISDLKTRIGITRGEQPEADDVPLTVRINLVPRWPHFYLDVTMLDGDGQPMPCTWRSAQRNSVLVSVPAAMSSCYVQIVKPTEPPQPLPSEEERTVREPMTGLEATICKWYDDREAALSFRFDDSHPTHIKKAIPMLREYGFTGTFFINPGVGDYVDNRDAWERCAAQGDQEFGNHTMHHSGAVGDDAIDHEIGDAARYIWSLFPGRSKLHALAWGGGSEWTHTRPLREFLERYYCFDVYGRPSVSMADVYGGRIEAFQRGLERALETHDWFTALFHQIGESTSDENFRRVLDLVKEREDALWIAGMAAVHKYETERNAAALRCTAIDVNNVRLTVMCSTDAELYDQPLTIALTLPNGWEAEEVEVIDADGAPVATRLSPSGNGVRLLFDVPPVSAQYMVHRG